LGLRFFAFRDGGRLVRPQRVPVVGRDEEPELEPRRDGEVAGALIRVAPPREQRRDSAQLRLDLQVRNGAADESRPVDFEAR